MDLSILIFLLCFIGPVLCGDYCYDNGRTFYCNYGCCGSYGDEYCCGVYSWIIAVAVVGSVALISFLVIGYCVWKKHNAKKGRVINTTSQGQNNVTHIPPPQQPPAYQHQPPSFQPQQQGLYPPPPPAYYGANPAYPPNR